MKSAIDLLDLPYTFWQLPLYTESQFRREAKARGLHITENQLEGLHRLRVLTPIFRVKRDGRAIAAAARRQDPFVWEQAHWEPTARGDLVEARAAFRLHDPTDEPFMARRRLQRQVGDITYRSSEYLYSHHQLLVLPTAKTAMRYFRYSNEGTIVGFDKDLPPAVTGQWPAQARWLQPRIVAISALEPIYYPRVVRRLRYGLDELEEYEDWQRGLEAAAMRDWLEADPDWLRESARILLYEADQLDPLGRWFEVVREGDPARWELLQGDARSVIDMRIGAEVLLSYYDRLVRAGLASKIEPPQARVRGEFGGRLRPKGGLDRILTDFGLSPHPRLILMVEGETELHMFPSLMEMFGMRLDRDFIAIESAQGVNKNIAALIAYAVAPQTERAEHGRYLRLDKPLTRLLAIMDAEGKMATAKGREKRWKAWVKRILDTLAAEDRTAPVRQSVERLVKVETWNDAGESFEFAHFSDEELSVAINEVDDRPKAPPLNQRIEIVARIRRERGNLDSTLKGQSKVGLAGALWPTLKAKIEHAEAEGHEQDIPIIRVLDQAANMAREFPRRNLVIPLRSAE
jgi:hypothetical protein